MYLTFNIHDVFHNMLPIPGIYVHQLEVISNKVAKGRYSDLDADDVWALIGVFMAGCIVYGQLLAIYRLYLHPLAGFPGPKICAVTEWYEFYCYIIKGGQWGNEVRRMHDKYGQLLGSLLLQLEPCW